MLGRDYEGQNCSVARTLELVGERWTLLVVRDAFLGRRRFEEFQESLGIARNVLADRLAKLVEHGIFERVRYQERPERHEYRLTPKGRDLWHVLTALRQWGDRWAAPDGPPLEMTHTACGHVVEAKPVCSRCGERLELHSPPKRATTTFCMARAGDVRARSQPCA